MSNEPRSVDSPGVSGPRGGAATPADEGRRGEPPRTRARRRSRVASGPQNPERNRQLICETQGCENARTREAPISREDAFWLTARKK